MAIWEIVLIAVFALAVILFIGGMVANDRRRSREDSTHAQRIAEADHALAAARAEDRGWHRAVLEDAARAAFAARGEDVTALELIQVVDRPGTDQDRARFRARTGEGFVELELARTGGSWQAAD